MDIQYINSEEKRKVFRQEALDAWTTMQRSGMHVTADEADAWLAQLEQGLDTEIPESHG